MRSHFPTREQLSAMSIERLRNVDIAEKDEEELVAEVLEARLANSPNVEVNLRVPDIKTKEEEDFWQEKIDTARSRKKAEEKPKGRKPKS